MDGLNGTRAASWLHFHRNHTPAVRLDVTRHNEGAPGPAAPPAGASITPEALTPLQAEYACRERKRAGLGD